MQARKGTRLLDEAVLTVHVLVRYGALGKTLRCRHFADNVALVVTGMGNEYLNR